MNTVAELLDSTKVLPVLTVDTAAQAVNVSRALQDGGMNAVEITLRTPAGVEAIRRVKAELPDLIVAAGTVTSTREMVAANIAGADFAVSPGMTSGLVHAAKDAEMPFLPGVATASEVLAALELGINHLKLFPAVAVGGVQLLRSLAAPYQDVKFCPTGGLNQQNFTDFLALSNVICIGGSWMVEQQLIESEDWQTVSVLAKQAVAAGMNV